MLQSRGVNQSGRKSPSRRGLLCDERGFSTLEWILVVAAVSGLATLGIIIIQRSLSSSGRPFEEGQSDLEFIAQEDANSANSQTACDVDEGELKKWDGLFTFNWISADTKCDAVPLQGSNRAP